MTSKSSFLVNARENHKRRIWVWIVSMLTELALYPGIMTVYLTRIRTRYESGAITTAQGLKAALCNAAADALGFKNQAVWAIIFLAAIIGAQGFSYLYSRKKVD
ncbi:MAG: hypothetical protein NC313_16460, partial [Butyrivibrio sp.]|nr:hypothetical protein [Butyrivibrio sp.]